MKYTQKTRDEVCRLYSNGETYKNIAEQTGVSRGVISNILKSEGIDFRKQRVKQKKCSNCGQIVSIKNAKHCPYCGKSILSEKEKATEKAKSLYAFGSLLPAGERDRFKEIVDSVVDYLAGGK